MSVTSVNSASKSQDIARQLSAEIDANKDGQISTSEFGNFILNVLEGKTSAQSSTTAFRSAMTSAPRTANAAGGSVNATFLGFDPSRAILTAGATSAGSLKYDAYNVLKNYDPRDPAAMKQAFAQLSAMHPGQYELDSQDNLMLTGTADGYIGARPLNRDSDWNNRAQDWGWQWHGYNAAHPGPNGELT